MTNDFDPAAALQEAEDLIAQVKTYFGYVERWHVVPMDSDIEAHWFLFDNGRGLCKSSVPFTAEIIEKGDIYSSLIHHGVLRKGDFVLIEEDTQCDGNQFLTLLSAKLECKDLALIVLYEECW